MFKVSIVPIKNKGMLIRAWNCYLCVCVQCLSLFKGSSCPACYIVMLCCVWTVLEWDVLCMYGTCGRTQITFVCQNGFVITLNDDMKVRCIFLLYPIYKYTMKEWKREWTQGELYYYQAKQVSHGIYYHVQWLRLIQCHLEPMHGDSPGCLPVLIACHVLNACRLLWQALRTLEHIWSTTQIFSLFFLAADALGELLLQPPQLLPFSLPPGDATPSRSIYVL
jgi:hypothetical protein